jgi:hypothetical protein
MPEKRDGFLKQADKFFKRLRNQDVIRLGDGSITQVDNAKSAEEQRRRSELSVFRQYLQTKNWSTKHIEQFAEYRKMDETYPLINAALKIYQEEVCLTGDTIIRTPMGDLTILDLIERGKDRDMFYVQSVYDRRTDWAMASYIKHNGKKKVFEVTIERNIDEDNLEWDTIEIPKFKCTDNHKIMLPDRSFKMLSELKEGDEIFSLETILSKAKEMHKQEIIDAWIGTDNKLQRLAAEQYYQETFFSKGSDDTQMERKLLKSGFVDIVPKQETLYTEEQVREVIRNCFKSNSLGFLITEDDMMRTIKQPKKD